MCHIGIHPKTKRKGDRRESSYDDFLFRAASTDVTGLTDRRCFQGTSRIDRWMERSFRLMSLDFFLTISESLLFSFIFPSIGFLATGTLEPTTTTLLHDTTSTKLKTQHDRTENETRTEPNTQIALNHTSISIAP